MTTAAVIGNETAILNRLVNPTMPSFSPEAARSLLQLNFDQVDRDRMHEFSIKVQEGTLGGAEQQELENYRRVGYFLDLLRSKARLALKKQGG